MASALHIITKVNKFTSSFHLNTHDYIEKSMKFHTKRLKVMFPLNISNWFQRLALTVTLLDPSGMNIKFFLAASISAGDASN